MNKRIKKRIQAFKKGFYTVEASVILVITTALIALLISYGFCLHDRAILMETALYDLRAAVQYLEEPVDLLGRLDADKITLHAPWEALSGGNKLVPLLLKTEYRLKAEDRLLLGNLEGASAALENGKLSLSYDSSFSYVDGSFAGILAGPEKRIERNLSLRRSPSPEENVRVIRALK